MGRSVLVFGGETGGLMQWLPTYCIAVFGHHKHCIKIFMCRETAYILHVIFHPVHLLYIKTEKNKKKTVGILMTLT